MVEMIFKRLFGETWQRIVKYIVSVTVSPGAHMPAGLVLTEDIVKAFYRNFI